MENEPVDLSRLVEEERIRLAEAERLAAEEDQLKKSVIASEEWKKEEEKRKRMHMASLLQEDAAKVALAAHNRIPLDARIGRFLPREIGWAVTISCVSHDNDGEGYQYRSWNNVHATILSPQGLLMTAKPVRTKQQDYPLADRPSLLRVLKRSAGVNEIVSVDEYNFMSYRKDLAKFVLAHSLKI